METIKSKLDVLPKEVKEEIKNVFSSVNTDTKILLINSDYVVIPQIKTKERSLEIDESEIIDFDEIFNHAIEYSNWESEIKRLKSNTNYLVDFCEARNILVIKIEG